MLWCQFLPFAALWGCPQAPKAPPDSVATIDKVIISTYIAELLAPPPPVTVTVTVGIAATPIVAATAVPDFYPSAAPGARPTAFQLDDIPDWTTLNTPLSYHNEIIAFGHWFEEASFRIDFEVSLLRLVVAAFMLSFVHMLGLFYYGLLRVLQTTFGTLCRGFRTGSTVLWILMSGVILCLTYDQLTESPATAIFCELLFLTEVHQDFVARFVRRILFVRQNGWQSLVPHCRLGRVILDSCCRFGRAILDSCRRKLAVVWRRLIHLLVPVMVKLASLMWNLTRTCLRHVGTTLTEQGYTWKSPFKLLRNLMYSTWRFCLISYLYIRLLIWVYVQRPCPCKGKTRWEVNPELATSWRQREALIDLAQMSIWDLAALIMERDDLKLDLQNLEPEIRASIERAIEGTTVELGKRAISWRTSHRELCMDYNHCRQTLDNAMNLVVCLMLNLDTDGEQGHEARFFKSHGLTVTDEPMPNGLHYKPNNWFGTDQIDPFKKRRTEPDIRAILSRMRRGTKGQRLTLIGRIDMYNEKSHAFDLHKIGFHFPAHLPDHNPFDLAQFRAKNHPQRDRKIEDYAAEGRVTEWYIDLPARDEREAQRAAMHPFFKTWT